MNTPTALLILIVAAIAGCVANPQGFTTRTRAAIVAEYTATAGPTARAEFFAEFSR